MPETYTTNYGFVKPYNGERNWDVPLNQTIDMIDSAIKNVQSGIPTLSVSSLSLSGTNVFLRGDVHLAAGPGMTIRVRANTNTIEFSGIGGASSVGEVTSLSVLGDATLLTNDVKLQAGPGITLVRNSPNNSIVISGTAVSTVTSISDVTSSNVFMNAIKFAAGPNQTITFRAATNTIEFSGIGTSTTNTFYDQIKFNQNGLLEIAQKVDGPYVLNHNGSITSVRGYRQGAGTSGTTIVDVALNSNSIFTQSSNKLQFLASDGNNIKRQSSAPAVTSFSAGDDISINLSQLEAGSPSDLAVTIEISNT